MQVWREGEVGETDGRKMHHAEKLLYHVGGLGFQCGGDSREDISLTLQEALEINNKPTESKPGRVPTMPRTNCHMILAWVPPYM